MISAAIAAVATEAGSGLLSGMLLTGVKKILNKKNENIENEENEKKEQIELIKQLMTIRHTVSYFSTYHKDFIEQYGEDTEEELFLSLLYEKKDRHYYQFENEEVVKVSSYCPSIFELYDEIEKVLYTTNIFWNENYFDSNEIIRLFNSVRYSKSQFDLGEDLPHEDLFNISEDLLILEQEIYSLLNNPSDN